MTGVQTCALPISGWGASCWAVQNEKAYFGANGQVMQAFVGIRDNADLAGNNGDIYQATAQQAFNYFEKPGQKKKFNLIRLTATSAGNPAIAIGVNIDFEFGIVPKSISPSAQLNSVWGSALWGTAVWQRSLRTLRTWQKVNGIGYAASLTVVIDATAKTTWCSTDWIVEVAGVL